MIEPEINDDSAEAPRPRGEAATNRAHRCVAVRIAVDASVEQNARLVAGWHLPVDRTLDEIAHQVSQQVIGTVAGEQQVAEIVHVVCFTRERQLVWFGTGEISSDRYTTDPSLRSEDSSR